MKAHCARGHKASPFDCFCGKCGAPVTVVKDDPCPKCNHECFSEDEYCTKCGTRLKKPEEKGGNTK